MYWLVALVSLSLVATVALGFWYEINPVAPGGRVPRWVRNGVGANLLTFVIAEVGMLLLGLHDAMAEPAVAAGTREISLGMGLAMIGVGIPTGLATIGAGIAVGPVGAASLAVIAEKPEAFGRSLIYLGLAEGIAIYGLVVSILILGRLG